MLARSVARARTSPPADTAGATPAAGAGSIVADGTSRDPAPGDAVVIARPERMPAARHRRDATVLTW